MLLNYSYCLAGISIICTVVNFNKFDIRINTFLKGKTFVKGTNIKNIFN